MENAFKAVILMVGGILVLSTWGVSVALLLASARVAGEAGWCTN